MNVCSVVSILETGPHRIRDLLAAAPAGTLAVAGGGVDLTYDQLRDEVDDDARALLALGVGRGDRVALGGPPSPDLWRLFLAAASIGAVWSADGRRPPDDGPGRAAFLAAGEAVGPGRLISARADVTADDSAIIRPDGGAWSQKAVATSARAVAAARGAEPTRWLVSGASDPVETITDVCMPALAAGGTAVFGLG